MKKRKFTFSTTHIISLGFLFVILIGSLLLSLPISSATGEPVPYIDALFSATTATCVTGLVTKTTAFTYSTFGHIVILILIQVGGLGVITVMSGFLMAMHKKIGLKDSQLIQDAFNLNSLSGLTAFVKKVIVGTFIVEGIGAILYMFVFVPDFGVKGIWISIFNSISGFCNAGIDIFASDSMCSYNTHPLSNFVTCSLIVLGGLGFIVWWDVLRVFKYFKKEKFRCLKRLTLHSKIALTGTFILIFLGAALIFFFEYNHAFANYSFYDKIQLAFFQSVTTRTAGFASVPQTDLTTPTCIICIVLMFIGGSPVGTAGGIKTVTLIVLIRSAVSVIRNDNEVNIFHRNISKQSIDKAVAVTVMFVGILVASTTLLCYVQPSVSLLDALYETTSALATVGLSRDLSPKLLPVAKLIIIATMYLGRIGPISLAINFSNKKSRQNTIKNPTEEISVG